MWGEHHVDGYNHPPLGDEAANVVTEANQKSLLEQIDAVKALMKYNKNPETLAAQDAQLNSLLMQYAMGRRLKFGELPR